MQKQFLNSIKQEVIKVLQEAKEWDEFDRNPKGWTQEGLNTFRNKMVKKYGLIGPAWQEQIEFDGFLNTEMIKQAISFAGNFQKQFLSPEGQINKMFTDPAKVYRLGQDDMKRLWNACSFFIYDVPYSHVSKKTLESIVSKFRDAFLEAYSNYRKTSGIKDRTQISNVVFENLLSQMEGKKGYKSAKDFTFDTTTIIAPEEETPFVGTWNENKTSNEYPIFLLEEMTKTEIKDLIKDEIKKNLDKMVRDELEKALKDNKDIKNQIGDLSKEILKMLYKDLSIHHGYVIDRVRF